MEEQPVLSFILINLSSVFFLYFNTEPKESAESCVYRRICVWEEDNTLINFLLLFFYVKCWAKIEKQIHH